MKEPPTAVPPSSTDSNIVIGSAAQSGGFAQSGGVFPQSGGFAQSCGLFGQSGGFASGSYGDVAVEGEPQARGFSDSGAPTKSPSRKARGSGVESCGEAGGWDARASDDNLI